MRCLGREIDIEPTEETMREVDARLAAKKHDPVNHPTHYTGGPIECIEAIEAMGIGPEFCRGNAVKYLWRLGKKGEALEQARKAKWYVDRLVKILEEGNQ